MRFNKLCLVIWALGASTSVDACVCRWFSDQAAAPAEIARAAASAEYVILGTVVAETSIPPVPSELSRSCPAAAFWRVLNVERVIARHGYAIPERRAPFSLITMVGRISSLSAESCDERTTCDVWPAIGRSGIWALRKSADGQYQFANSCTTDAVRRFWKDPSTPPLAYPRASGRIPRTERTDAR